jgi:hypothetical protein
MKAEELRIGNLVFSTYENENVTINYITAVSAGYGKKSFHTLEGFEPIPLTPEILAQLGFKKLPVSWGCDKFHLTEWDEFPLNWCVSMNVNNAILVLRLVHVHQLQNLYWCLTGQELTLAEK